jgi:hypothetical protein
MARRDDTALQALRHISAETATTLDKIVATSDHVSSRSSSSLFGALGALIGVSVAYLLSALVPTVSFVELGPMLGGAGLLSPMLVFRGRKLMQLERQTEEQKMLLQRNRMVWDDYLERMRKLPKDVPPEVKNELWRRIIHIDQSMDGVTTKKTELLPPPSQTPLLPSPTKQQKLAESTVQESDREEIRGDRKAGEELD